MKEIQLEGRQSPAVRVCVLASLCQSRLNQQKQTVKTHLISQSFSCCLTPKPLSVSETSTSVFPESPADRNGSIEARGLFFWRGGIFVSLLDCFPGGRLRYVYIPVWKLNWFHYRAERPTTGPQRATNPRQCVCFCAFAC